MTELNCNLKKPAADFDIEGGSKPEAIDSFLQVIYDHIQLDSPTMTDDTVLLTVAGKTIALYDHAALIQGLIDALEYLKSEL